MSVVWMQNKYFSPLSLFLSLSLYSILTQILMVMGDITLNALLGLDMNTTDIG